MGLAALAFISLDEGHPGETEQVRADLYSFRII